MRTKSDAEKMCALCEGDGYFYISFFPWLNEYCVLQGFRKKQLDSHNSKIFKIDCPECTELCKNNRNILATIVDNNIVPKIIECPEHWK